MFTCKSGFGMCFYLQNYDSLWYTWCRCAAWHKGCHRSIGSMALGTTLFYLKLTIILQMWVRYPLTRNLGRFDQFLGWVISALVAGSFWPIFEVSCFGQSIQKPLRYCRERQGDFRFGDSI